MLKKIGNIIVTVAIVILMAFIILNLCGIPSYAVKTGSMEPDIKQGSLIWVKRLSPAQINETMVGTDITYHVGDNIVTHRIIAVDEETETVTTQGINGDNPIKETVKYSDVIGVVLFSIPLLGYLYMVMANIYFIIILGLIVLLLIILSAFKKEKKKTEA